MKSLKKPFYKRWWFILITIIAAICAVNSIKAGIRDAAEKKSTYIWPDNALANMIPQPDSKYGKIVMENEDHFAIDIYRMSVKKFEKYVEDCKTNGFAVNYSRTGDVYSAENENGDSLTLNYDEKENILSISLYAFVEEIPSEEKNEDASSAELTEGEEEGMYDSADEVKGPQEENDAEDSVEDDPEGSGTSNGIRPEFKDMLDSYESFMNEYCEFMEKYAESDDSISMLQDYTRLVQEELEWVKKIDDLEGEEMNDAEAKYYAEVTFRVSQKLIEASL